MAPSLTKKYNQMYILFGLWVLGLGLLFINPYLAVLAWSIPAGYGAGDALFNIVQKRKRKEYERNRDAREKAERETREANTRADV